jgi:NitT/TauT family transport system permease protein
MNTHLKKLADQIVNVSGIIVLILIWEIAPRIGMVDKQFFPPLSQVLLFLGSLAASGKLFLHVAASLQRIFIGLVLATAIAVPTGFLLGGVFPSLSRKLVPLFRLLEQVNPLCLYIIFMLFFGIGEKVKIIIIFWAIIWPILFTTIAGVQQVNPLYIKIARSFGADKFTVFSKVILPGAAPAIFTGIRAGATHAFFILVIAETMGAYFGLGRLIRTSAFGAFIIIALLGMTIDYLLHLLESSLLDWKHSLKREENKYSIK